MKSSRNCRLPVDANLMVVKRRALREATHIQVLTGTPRYSGPELGHTAVSLERLFDGARSRRFGSSSRPYP